MECVRYVRESSFIEERSSGDVKSGWTWRWLGPGFIGGVRRLRRLCVEKEGGGGCGFEGLEGWTRSLKKAEADSGWIED